MNDIKNIEESLKVLSSRLGYGFLNEWKTKSPKYKNYIQVCRDLINAGKSDKYIEKFFSKEYNINDYEAMFLIEDAKKPELQNSNIPEVPTEEEQKVNDEFDNFGEEPKQNNPTENVKDLQKFYVPEMSDSVHKEFEDFGADEKELQEINQRPYDFEGEWTELVASHYLNDGDIIIGTKRGEVDACKITTLLNNGTVYMLDADGNKKTFDAKEINKIRRVKKDKLKSITEKLKLLNGK